MRFGKLKCCFVIAEVSANHGQNFRRAVSMVRRAAACGADAVKFQTYTPESLTIDCDKRLFRVRHDKWGGQTLYDLYRKAYTPLHWFEKLKTVADDEGITFLSTAFDKPGVDLLESLNVPAHKVASFELVDLPLIHYAASTRKPLILSTGMATTKEIHEAVTTAREAGAPEVVLLKCVSAYPAKASQMNLRSIPVLAERFGGPVGLSDHSDGTAAAVAAVALGARVIEKHFILSRKTETPDSFFSIEPPELSRLVSDVRTAESALGKAVFGPVGDQRASLVFRRSLIAVQDIAKGERLTEQNVRSIRPAGGLAPKHLPRVVGRRTAQRITRGTPLTWDLLE